jgi:translation initiation factor 3 subunit D
MSGDIRVVVRTSLSGVLRKNGASHLLSVVTLNEWDSKVAGTIEWRKSIAAQRGALLATEIKNNNHRLAKATTCALLAGAESMRLGFVSRMSRTDADSHCILAVSSVPSGNFAKELSLHLNNAWGIIRWLVETVRKHAKNLKEEEQPEDEYIAKFVLMRDPNKETMYLYNVAVDAFEREDETDIMLGPIEGDGWGESAVRVTRNVQENEVGRLEMEDEEEHAAVANAPAAKKGREAPSSLSTQM